MSEGCSRRTAQAAQASTASRRWKLLARWELAALRLFPVPAASQGLFFFLSQAIWRAPSSVQHPNCSSTVISPDVSWFYEGKLQYWGSSVRLVNAMTQPAPLRMEDCSACVNEDNRCKGKRKYYRKSRKMYKGWDWWIELIFQWKYRQLNYKDYNECYLNSLMSCPCRINARSLLGFGGSRKRGVFQTPSFQ